MNFGYRYLVSVSVWILGIGIGIGIGMDLQQGIGIGIRVSVEHYCAVTIPAAIRHAVSQLAETGRYELRAENKLGTT